MPRKFRKEYPGATYHVINRGNYRQPAFADDRTKEAFKGCIFEACEKSAWVFHSVVGRALSRIAIDVTFMYIKTTYDGI